jgi:hypothetical protein
VLRSPESHQRPNAIEEEDMNRVSRVTVASVAALACTAGIVAAASPGVSSIAVLPPGGKVTLHYKGLLKGSDVTNGGVAPTGRFTASGAITDKGTFRDYRTQKGSTIRIRRVTVGTKGTITFIIVIDISLGQNKGWTIASGTKTYKGLHGRGAEEGGVMGNALDVTLKGRVFR